jgi:hypothetical protein
VEKTDVLKITPFSRRSWWSYLEVYCRLYGVKAILKKKEFSSTVVLKIINSN